MSEAFSSEEVKVHSKTMRVTKRNGEMEDVDLNKIVKAVNRCSQGLKDVDPMRVATKTISGLYDGASTSELDRLSIQTAASLIAEEPEYSNLAASLLAAYIHKEVEQHEVYAFSQSVDLGHKLGLVNKRLASFVKKNARKLNAAIDDSQDSEFQYFGLRTLYDRYLLRHPTARTVIETPQHFFMRIAAALSSSTTEAVELYGLMSRLEYLPSSPTLFNSGANFEQLSSCFLLDSPSDSLKGIYARYFDAAALSQFSGGLGIAYHRVRSRGSLIKSTNGHSNGIVPWLKTFDSSVAAVNQGGRRKGAACIYLETWHPDIEEFLELRDNTGDEASRTHNLNLANWVPDLFMKRVAEDGMWSLFDPKDHPTLPDLHGDEFEEAYTNAEWAGTFVRQVKARDLYGKMMRTLAQTGNGWMTFKDKCNAACNQVGPGNAVHLSNLCTEIVEVTSLEETAVCNLGSINLARHVVVSDDGSISFDFQKLANSVRIAVRQLDSVIDVNLYTLPGAKKSNMRWRPIGLGFMGLQDVFFQLGLPFDSDAAKELSTRISEEIYFHALQASTDLAEAKGQHPSFPDTKAAKGRLQFDDWGVTPADSDRWDALKDRIVKVGLRNSLLCAIAPTATIASIAGCYECIEPQVSNLFKRETLSGDFVQINRYLVDELKRRDLWNSETLDALKSSEGSVQNLDLPEELKGIYRTAWEIPMRSLIDMAAARGAYIDQSQSLNLFIESPNIGQLSSMYFYAWKAGLKTTYYLRSRPATRIAKTTVSSSSSSSSQTAKPADAEAVACSLENPESCEACQ